MSQPPGWVLESAMIERFPIGLTDRPRHGRACPGHPDAEGTVRP